jgi:hypothetical protein
MKWPQKMLTFLEIHYPKSLENADESVMAFLRGEEEKEEVEEKDEEMKQEEDAEDLERDFLAAKTFGGPKPGFVFKTGTRGTGYYRDSTAKKEIVKKEKKE